MSHFVECKTEFRDPQALVAALIECGFAAEQIEVHPEAVPLLGYQGDVRPQQAHIVIRREHVGSGANDVGWERQSDGSYRAGSANSTPVSGSTSTGPIRRGSTRPRRTGCDRNTPTRSSSASSGPAGAPFRASGCPAARSRW
jgi:hypothetical protein